MLSPTVLIKGNKPQKYMEQCRYRSTLFSLSIRWCSQLHALASLLPRTQPHVSMNMSQSAWIEE